MTAPESIPWKPDRADLQAALSALLARVEGDERSAALVIVQASQEGRAYQVMDATWWLFNRTCGDFTTRPDLRDRLRRDILTLAAMEDEEGQDQ